MPVVTVSKWQGQGSNPGRPRSGPLLAIHCIDQNAQSPGVREPGPVSPPEQPLPRARACRCVTHFSITVFRTAVRVLETLEGIVGGPELMEPAELGLELSGSVEFHVSPRLSIRTVCAVSGSPVTLARARPRSDQPLCACRPPGPGCSCLTSGFVSCGVGGLCWEYLWE